MANKNNKRIEESYKTKNPDNLPKMYLGFHYIIKGNMGLGLYRHVNVTLG